MVTKFKINIQQTTLHTAQSCVYFHQVFCSCVWHSSPHDGRGHCLSVCQVTRRCDSCHCFRIVQIRLTLSSCHHTGLCSNYELCLGSRRRTVQSVSSLERGAEMHPAVSLNTALAAVSCLYYLSLVWLTLTPTRYTSP